MIRRHWPLVAAIAFLWVLMLGTLLVSLRSNDGTLIYALDDPYIHMAMAKHWAADGLPGVTPYEFSSSSSSPLWLVMLTAIYAVTGPLASIPLLLNWIAATGAIVAAYAIVKDHVESHRARAILLVAFILFVPMVTVVFCGMEHILHLLIALCFLGAASRSLAARGMQPGRVRRRDDLRLILLAPLLSSIRYEGAMMIGVVALFLLFRRRFIFASLLLIVGALPLVAYGLFSMAHGWGFLPMSLHLKGNVLNFSSLHGIASWLTSGIYAQLIHESHILVLLTIGIITLAIELWRRRTFWSVPTVMQAIVLLTAVMHLQFASVGWLHRYEAYLVGLWTIAIGIGWCRIFPELVAWAHRTADGRRAAIMVSAVALFILLVPFIHRGLKILITPRATTNIYEQQYQMARFVREFYPQRHVVFNDIGAVTFWTDAHILDFFGLGSLGAGELRSRGLMSTRAIDSLAIADGMEIAIVYDEWLDNDGGVPERWTKVREWEISNNVVCGNPVVSFYAIEPRYADELERNLDAFSTKLPPTVKQRRFSAVSVANRELGAGSR